MATYRGSDGRSYKLRKVIRKGGEGQIHEVSALPNDVAKIWNKPSIQRARKLDALLRHGPQIRPALRAVLGLAWPSVALSDKRGTTVGFLMRKVPLDRYHELVNYCIPDRRRDLEAARGSAFSRTDLMTIALNVALLFAHLHRSGYVIGDVNHTNILAAADGRIFLIDVDSIQTADPDTGEVYRCTVGKDDFTPPRLVGRRFEEVDRVVEDDLFGLAVLIFQILMDGCHPYDAVDQSGKQGHTRAENIRISNSPFARLDFDQAKAYFDLDTITNTKLREQKRAKFLASIEGTATADFATLIVPRVALWLDLEPNFRDLFARAFGNAAGARPTALEWLLALDEAGARKPAATPATITPSQPASPPPRTVNRPSTASARKAAKRSPISPLLSTKPQPIIRSSSITPQASAPSRLAKRVGKKSGKKTSRKKSAKRSARFSPSPPTPSAASQGGVTLNWMAVGLMVVLIAGLFFSFRDEIGQPSEPTLAQSATPCASLKPWADLRGCALSGKDLRGVNLTGVDLRHSDLTATNLEGTVLHSANLANANLTRANLKNANLWGATLSGASFVEADLSRSSIIKANLKGADFTKAKLHETDFHQSVLKGATFERAEIQKAYFFYADLSRANMTGANAHGAFFVDADVSGVDFSESDLSSASFTDANVRGANFSDADLTNAYFGSSSNVRKAIFGSTVCSDGIESDDCFLEGRLLGI